LPAFGSGVLLFASDYPVHAWPLQLVALAPMLWALARLRPRLRHAAQAGAVLGLSYTVPTVVALGLPVLMGGPLALYSSALWALLVALAALAMRGRSTAGALAVGAIAAVVQWADFTLVPVWGTAQAFVRVWTAAPQAIGLVSLTGVTGLVFAIVALQALAVLIALEPTRRRAAALTLAALVVAVAGVNAASWARKPVGSLRVAAVGWTSIDLKRRDAAGSRAVLETVYRPLLERAVAAGARLVVSPVVGLRLSPADREATIARLGQLARQHEVWLAVGAFDHGHDDNRLLFIDPSGALRGQYRKTHLIVGLERYKAGSGEPVVLDAGQARLGGMICQDDNFTDLSRAYGRERVQLLAVPTNDWSQVKNHHLENSLFRPVESGYGIVRAASNGISAIASYRGEVLARKDHFVDGPGVIVAELPLGSGGTLYSRFGDWFVLACAAALAAALLGRARSRYGGSTS